MQNQGLPGKDIDFVRTGRMATFGLLFYGPLQHRWYGLLASRFPGTSTQNFLSKARSCPYCMHCLLLWREWCAVMAPVKCRQRPLGLRNQAVAQP